jgi:hypothetical protein
LPDLTPKAGSGGGIRGSATMRVAKLITGTRSGREIFLIDRDLTVTCANVRKHLETVDLKIRLN